MSRQTPEKDYLSRETTTCLKGLLAVAIILAHWRNFVPFLHDTVLGMMLTAAGYLGVGAFFFLSGYGLRTQGRDYLKRFPRSRIAPYYATCLVAVGVYTAAELMAGRSILPEQVLRSLTWYGTIVDYGWYLQAQLLLYLLFWLVYRGQERRWNPVLLIGLYALLCMPMKDFLWYDSMLCFPLGIWWSDYQRSAKQCLQKHWAVCCVLSFLAFGGTVLLGNLPILPAWPMHLVKMLSAMMFVAFIVVLLVRVPICNPVTRFLGKYSGEMYIMQGIGFRLFRGVMESGQYWLQLLGILAVSVLGGMVLHVIFGWTRTAVKHLLTVRLSDSANK